MSKGNMLLGYARGSVGDVVFARIKGQQTTRARNRHPYNPRTEPQMLQRARFLNASNFFSRGVQNLFVFAYEDQGTKESAFNAYMRNNALRGWLVSPKAGRMTTYPAAGRWLMTRGSLVTPYWRLPSADENEWSVRLSTDDLEDSWATVSNSLIQNYGYRNGDVITMVDIRAMDSDDTNTPSADPEERLSIFWNINQVVIDENNTDSVSLATNGVLDVDGGRLIHVDQYQQMIHSFAFIVSRRTRRKLRVTTSELLPNQMYRECEEKANSDLYKQQVLNAWEIAEEPILPGPSV